MIEQDTTSGYYGPRSRKETQRLLVGLLYPEDISQNNPEHNTFDQEYDSDRQQRLSVAISRKAATSRKFRKEIFQPAENILYTYLQTVGTYSEDDGGYIVEGPNAITGLVAAQNFLEEVHKLSEHPLYDKLPSRILFWKRNKARTQQIIAYADKYLDYELDQDIEPELLKTLGLRRAREIVKVRDQVRQALQTPEDIAKRKDTIRALRRKSRSLRRRRGLNIGIVGALEAIPLASTGIPTAIMAQAQMHHLSEVPIHGEHITDFLLQASQDPHAGVAVMGLILLMNAYALRLVNSPERYTQRVYKEFIHELQTLEPQIGSTLLKWVQNKFQALQMVTEEKAGDIVTSGRQITEHARKGMNLVKDTVGNSSLKMKNTIIFSGQKVKEQAIVSSRQIKDRTIRQLSALHMSLHRLRS